MNFNNLFNMQGMLFAVMLLGLFLRKKGMITDEGKALLTDLVIDVTLPASILKAFQIEFSMDILKSCIVIFILTIVFQIFSWAVGFVLYPGFDPKHKKVLQYATICSNAGILGNPIAEGIFGSMGLLYASVYLIPQRTFMWSLGLTYFTECPDKKTLAKKVLTHPCILAVFFGFILLITQVQLPGVVNQTIKTLANANTATCMILIGSILAGVPFKSLAGKDTLYYSFVRLILMPLLIWGGCRLAGIDSLVTNISVVLAGMPAASVTAILAEKYDSDAEFATRCVVLSTLLSVVTVPLLCIFLTAFTA